MARLPKKPVNIVHEFFPVGTDGHSPMNKIDGAFEAMLVAEGRHPKHNKKDEDKDGDNLFNKIDTPALAAEPAEFKPGKSPEERANEILKLKADTAKATKEGLLNKIDVRKVSKIKKKQGHVTTDLSNLTSEEKKKVIKAGGGDKGGFNTGGSADLAASGLRASNELKNRRR